MELFVVYIDFFKTCQNSIELNGCLTIFSCLKKFHVHKSLSINVVQVIFSYVTFLLLSGKHVPRVRMIERKISEARDFGSVFSRCSGIGLFS